MQREAQLALAVATMDSAAAVALATAVSPALQQVGLAVGCCSTEDSCGVAEAVDKEQNFLLDHLAEVEAVEAVVVVEGRKWTGYWVVASQMVGSILWEQSG